MVDELLSKGSIGNWELEWRTRSGEPRTILRSAELITIAGKACIIAVNKDISERKKMEIALLESREKWMDLADSLPQVVFEIDMNGSLTFVNRNAFDVFGYTKEEFRRGLNVFEMVAPQDRQRAIVNLTRKLTGETLDSAEYMVMRKDGTLNISLAGGFTPAAPDSFRIVSAGSRTGAFATVNGSLFNGGRFFGSPRRPSQELKRAVSSPHT